MLRGHVRSDVPFSCECRRLFRYVPLSTSLEQILLAIVGVRTNFSYADQVHACHGLHKLLMLVPREIAPRQHDCRRHDVQKTDHLTTR